MYSSHPSLSIFYSGDRSGNVCRVDVDGSASLSEGECVLLCKEVRCTDGIGNEGINSLRVLDDQFVFTATASSTINCWRVPGSRHARIAEGAGGETGRETPTASPAPLAGTAPFGFSQDSMQPSLLRSRQRDSFSGEREGWARSDSPSSIDRRMESPTRTSPRNIPKHLSSMSMEPLSSLNPSDSSLHTAVGNAQPTSNSNLFGIPYQSLVKLSSASDGWVSPLFPRVKDSDAATLYSAASIRSVPVPIHQLSFRGQGEAMRSSVQPQSAINAILRRSRASFDGVTVGTAMSGGGLGARVAANHPEEMEDAARLAYEIRDVAVDATPVRSRPDYVIQGTQGIVRSVVLNDRWHALTVDTNGHVGVWDIVRGVCIGMYEKQDVEQASRNENSRGPQDDEWKWSPREALDVVRDRIEGEAVVHAWCTVDTSIGNLMVHITSTQAFDAEIFADEAGYHGEFKFEEDHRREYFLAYVTKPLCSQGHSEYWQMDTGQSIRSLRRTAEDHTIRAGLFL
jgi:WD repeat-containing protein 48